MKSLLRLATTLSIIGSTAFGFGLSSWQKAIALPEAQLEEKLSIPVFAVTDAEGAPLVASGEDGEKVTGIFISLEAAQAFLARLREEQPDLGNQIQVVPLSMNDVRNLEAENESEGLDFTYVPMEKQVVAAFLLLCQQQGEDCPSENLQILRGLRQQLNADPEGLSDEQNAILRNLITQFGGVPVFIARGGEGGGYLTVKLSEESPEVIPVFFEREQVQQRVVETFQAQYPQQANTVMIDVVPLEDIIATLASDDNELIRKIVIVPSRETLRLFQEAERNNSGNGNNTPTP